MSADRVRVTVNGETRELATGATVASVVQELTGRPEGRGVAVALGGEIVPRGEWPRTSLPDGAEVEVVTAVQGG
jgi:sulfur carrier protein